SRFGSRRRTTRRCSRTTGSSGTRSASAPTRSSASKRSTLRGEAPSGASPLVCFETVTDTPTLELRGISKSFGSVQALTDVDFEVRSGEVMALVGDNGAGKSTLIKCVAGIHAIDSGTVLFEGEEVHIHGPKDAVRLGFEVVYQHLALCDNLYVVQNMYLGPEDYDVLQRLNQTVMMPRTRETLKS